MIGREIKKQFYSRLLRLNRFNKNSLSPMLNIIITLFIFLKEEIHNRIYYGLKYCNLVTVDETNFRQVCLNRIKTRHSFFSTRCSSQVSGLHKWVH